MPLMMRWKEAFFLSNDAIKAVSIAKKTSKNQNYLVSTKTALSMLNHLTFIREYYVITTMLFLTMHS